VQNPLCGGREAAGGRGGRSVAARPARQRLGLRAPESRPTRIVFDSLDTLADYVRTPHALVQDLKSLLERTDAVAYVLLRSDNASNADAAAFEPLVGLADGCFRLLVKDTGQLCFQFLKVPDVAVRPDEFPFSLRIGAGFVEDLVLDVPDLTARERHTLVVLDEIAGLSGDVLEGMQLTYELELLETPVGAWAGSPPEGTERS
jgi:hypothetical protein